MSEGTENTEVKPESKSIPDEVRAEVVKAQQDAVTAALEEFRKESDKNTRQLLDDQRTRIVRALSGEVDQGENNIKLVEKFLQDPSQVFHNVKEIAKEEIRAEIQELEKERDAKAEKARDINIAVFETLQSRPDINSSKEARKLLDSFFNQTAESLPAKDRVAQAIKEYDLLMDKIDGKSAEERVKAAMSVSTSSSASSAAQPAKTLFEREDDARQAYINERREAYAKKANGVLGRSRVVSVK